MKRRIQGLSEMAQPAPVLCPTACSSSASTAHIPLAFSKALLHPSSLRS
jgi:hypothetical protein